MVSSVSVASGPSFAISHFRPVQWRTGRFLFRIFGAQNGYIPRVTLASVDPRSEIVDPPRISLCFLPTPLHRLDRASEALGIDLWIKRDDMTGFALGGNKGRKLEYLMADVLASGADVVVSCGGIHSNFLRQLAAGCAKCGVACATAVMELPYEDGPAEGRRPSAEGGNQVLDRLFGMDLRLHPDSNWDTLFAHAEDLAKSFEAEGKKVYRMPLGGSSPLGAFGFWKAAHELPDDVEAIVFASSSGSTHIGLATYFFGTDVAVEGMACDPEPQITEDFADLSRRLNELTGLPALKASDLRLDMSSVGAGYGLMSDEADEAVKWLARLEGIVLDPIYSGKAFGALLRRREEFAGKKTVFWHTGGVPTVFAV
ncbi:pyridoxal-phosphate dependent enzyme [bacterium]|nr:MAG: pyridoxal-phosphate dependent enzyme [bacterium]